MGNPQSKKSTNQPTNARIPEEGEEGEEGATTSTEEQKAIEHLKSVRFANIGRLCGAMFQKIIDLYGENGTDKFSVKTEITVNEFNLYVKNHKPGYTNIVKAMRKTDSGVLHFEINNDKIS
jgi:hypothetical protein